MTCLLILLLSAQNLINEKMIQKLSPEKKMEMVVRLVKDGKYEEALSLCNDPGLRGRVKILKGETFEGLLDVKESAMKGDVGSCNLFLLSKMGSPDEDIKAFIKREYGIDSNASVSSPYSAYLIFPAESLSAESSTPDSLLTPFILLRKGLINIDENPEEAKDYFSCLITAYPKSIPAIIARDLIRVVEEKISRQKYPGFENLKKEK